MSELAADSDCASASVQLLAALQHADSFFPTGAIAFSSGLETLVEEQTITNATTLHAYVRSQLHGRWAYFERPALVASHQVARVLDEVAAIDQLIEAQTLAMEQRNGSRQIGASLLALHTRMGTPGAFDYQQRVKRGAAPGHAIVVQGMLWNQSSIACLAAQAISAHQLQIGLLGAGLRLGIVGHIDCQKITNALRSDVGELLASAPPGLTELHSFVPQSEIAVMRHEVSSSRLFAS